ncbi:peptidoglycan recognition protein-like [Macrosteles quadrilineatus]|uniref:peptidoglycan recognition protein-like n=1 Tax=Macrosteles quadrilineatus TaxID=74068 RepID=UPI0023E17065|nr:peptidoglycan recognition protein-like [Macrosteles quadrilineatus]
MGANNAKLEDKPINIVSRKTWGAKAPFHEDPISLPVSLVVFMATQDFKFPLEDKKASYKALRELQQFHMYQRYMPDIQYNFMIDENGTIYEGRGWFRKPSHNPGDITANLNSIYIGYVGEIAEDGPSDDMMISGNDLIGYGMKREYIRYHHHIKGLITGIVGTTLEDCIRRKKSDPSDSEGEGPKEALPMEQFYVM